MTRLPRGGAILLAAIALLLSPGASNPVRGEAARASQKENSGSVCQRSAFRVILDVGHTFQAPGARSARGVYEFVFNLRLAQLIEEKLMAAGFDRTVLLITDGPARKGLAQRVARANGLSADLLLSIHHDSVPNVFLAKWEFEGEERSFSDRFKGHSIFVSNASSDPKGSLLFATFLGRALKAQGLQYTPHYTERIMGSRQRQLVDADAGVYRYDQLIVLKNTNMAAVLLEAGSIINRDEEVLMDAPDHQSLIVTAVTDAVEKFCAVRRPRNPAPAQPRAEAGSAFKQSSRPSAAAR